MLKTAPWGAGYKDFCIFVFSPFRNIFRCFNFLGGYWIFWWPRLDSLKDGIMFAESGVANERVTTPFKKKTFFFLPFLPRWVNEEYRANARSHSDPNPASSGFRISGPKRPIRFFSGFDQKHKYRIVAIWGFKNEE